MATTRQELQTWFEDGVSKGYKYMLIITDTFDWEDAPHYCRTEDDARRKKADPGEMAKVMEVYDLTADMLEQLNVHRAMAL